MGWITAQERAGMIVQAPTIEIWAYGLDTITCWADLRKLINDAHTAVEHFYEVHCARIAPEQLAPVKAESQESNEDAR